MMARPRSFDESEILEAVMMAFWRNGHTATTYRSLETLSGVGIKSLANTFGDKDELFSKALARYRTMVAGTLGAMFDSPSLDSIVAVFERASSPAEGNDPRRGGCLMVNTVFEVGEPDAPIAHEIAQYRELFRSSFQRALDAEGIADSATRAGFLLGALWGALSQIRFAGDTAAARPTAAIVIETIRTWASDTEAVPV
jgi:TetR/AcrR family transcriptional repressor of nem operon